MTWEPYAKSVLENSNKHGHSAGILGKVDASDWATGEDCMKLEVHERPVLMRLFKSPVDPSRPDMAVASAGICLEGIKYLFIRITEENVYVFKKGTAGCALGASNTAIIMGRCIEGGNLPSVVSGVTTVMKYLLDLGY